MSRIPIYRDLSKGRRAALVDANGFERNTQHAHWRRDTNFDAVTLTGRHAITLVQMVGAWQTPTRRRTNLDEIVPL